MLCNFAWHFFCATNGSPRRLEGAKKHEGLVRRFCHECTNVGMVFCGEWFATKARRHKETRRIGAEVLPRMHECGNGFSFENFTAFNLSTSHQIILLQQSSPY